MPHFTRRLKTENGFLEFHFTAVDEDGRSYDITVVDEKGKRLKFEMLKTGDQWELIEPESSPPLVTSLIRELSHQLKESSG